MRFHFLPFFPLVLPSRSSLSAQHFADTSKSHPRLADVNRKDYRAWYGLGQTYELLGEPFYALDYYQRATALRPYDARMWSALAGCYEKLKRCVFPFFPLLRLSTVFRLFRLGSSGGVPE